MSEVLKSRPYLEWSQRERRLHLGRHLCEPDPAKPGIITSLCKLKYYNRKRLTINSTYSLRKRNAGDVRRIEVHRYLNHFFVNADVRVRLEVGSILVEEAAPDNAFLRRRRRRRGGGDSSSSSNEDAGAGSAARERILLSHDWRETNKQTIAARSYKRHAQGGRRGEAEAITITAIRYDRAAAAAWQRLKCTRQGRERKSKGGKHTCPCGRRLYRARRLPRQRSHYMISHTLLM